LFTNSKIVLPIQLCVYKLAWSIKPAAVGVNDH